MYNFLCGLCIFSDCILLYSSTIILLFFIFTFLVQSDPSIAINVSSSILITEPYTIEQSRWMDRGKTDEKDGWMMDLIHG